MMRGRLDLAKACLISNTVFFKGKVERCWGTKGGLDWVNTRFSVMIIHLKYSEIFTRYLGQEGTVFKVISAGTEVSHNYCSAPAKLSLKICSVRAETPCKICSVLATL